MINFQQMSIEFLKVTKLPNLYLEIFVNLNLELECLNLLRNLKPNLSGGLKQNSIFALRNLSSFLDTINAIYINTKEIKNKDDFLNSLNVACYQFSRYADVSQKLLIFKSICKSLHKVGV